MPRATAEAPAAEEATTAGTHLEQDFPTMRTKGHCLMGLKKLQFERFANTSADIFSTQHLRQQQRQQQSKLQKQHRGCMPAQFLVLAFNCEKQLAFCFGWRSQQSPAPW
mmetsp:Transcript_63049/g.124665  ORF Transcript_63049/g.124665 Transcript_63049/m.124665 type:complete len:109 (-) Transcript_63049:1285-1611(-)